MVQPFPHAGLTFVCGYRALISARNKSEMNLWCLFRNVVC
jgi:hypothetical protein